MLSLAPCDDRDVLIMVRFVIPHAVILSRFGRHVKLRYEIVTECGYNVNKRGQSVIKCDTTWTGKFNFEHVQNSVGFPHNVPQRGNNVIQRGNNLIQRTTTWQQHGYNVAQTWQNVNRTRVLRCCVSATLERWRCCCYVEKMAVVLF